MIDWHAIIGLAICVARIGAALWLKKNNLP